jgi:hypothetical protein
MFLIELRKQKYLLRSYLSKIENTLKEENIDFIDENDISYKSILNSYNFITEKINFYEKELNNSHKEKTNLFDFHLFTDISNQILNFTYKKYECEFNFFEFKCKKRDNWKRKVIG